MTKLHFKVIPRLMMAVLLGLIMAMIWMSSSPDPAFAQCGGDITIGYAVSGTYSGRYCYFYFYARAGDLVAIRMTRRSTSLDPYLELYDPQNQLVAYDDDSGGGYDSLVSYSVRRSGEYTIVARAYSGTGVFDIGMGTFIRNAQSRKCIDVQGAPGSQNLASLQLYDCEYSGRGPNNTPTDQRWEITGDGFIRNTQSGRCIDVQGAPGSQNLAPLQLYDCEYSGRGPNNTPTDQRWQIAGDGLIRNTQSGRCIDVQGAPGSQNLAPLQLYDCEYSGRGPNNTPTDQRWQMR